MCVVGRVHETVPAGDDVILNNMRGAASGASPSSVSIKVGRTRVTVTSLVSSNVTVRYNEASRGGVPGTTTNTTNAGIGSGGGGVVGAIGGSGPVGPGTGVVLAPSSRMSPPSNMDTSEGPTVVGGPAVALVKAETPEGQHRATTSASTVTGPVGSGNSLFAGIASSNKRPRPDDWLAPNSPSSPQGPLPNQHLIYTTPQQQLSGGLHQPPQQQQIQQQAQQQPSQQTGQQPQAQMLQQQQQAAPMAHSTPITQPQVQQQQQQQPQQQQQTQPNNNGYASPMSSGSYDPYSPNGKIGK